MAGGTKEQNKVCHAIIFRELSRSAFDISCRDLLSIIQKETEFKPSPNTINNIKKRVQEELKQVEIGLPERVKNANARRLDRNIKQMENEIAAMNPAEKKVTQEAAHVDDGNGNGGGGLSSQKLKEETNPSRQADIDSRRKTMLTYIQELNKMYGVYEATKIDVISKGEPIMGPPPPDNWEHKAIEIHRRALEKLTDDADSADRKTN